MRAFHVDLWSLSGKQEQFCSTRGVKCAAAIEQSKFSRSDGFLAGTIRAEVQKSFPPFIDRFASPADQQGTVSLL
jgi:hypothetical protein